MSLPEICPPELAQALQEAMRSLADQIHSKLENAAPARTGALRASLYREDDTTLPDQIVASDSPVAVFTDQGTRRQRGTLWFTRTCENFRGETL